MECIILFNERFYDTRDVAFIIQVASAYEFLVSDTLLRSFLQNRVIINKDNNTNNYYTAT